MYDGRERPWLTLFIEDINVSYLNADPEKVRSILTSVGAIDKV